MHNASFSEHLASWDRLANGVSSRAAEIRALTLSQREELIQARNKAWEAHLRRLAARAAAQQATRDLEAAMAEAHEVATRLRCSLWGQYGRESPHLHVFGMRPYPCSRARRAAVAVLKGESLPNVVPEPAPPPPAPEVKGEPSPPVSETEDRRGAVPQREPDAQTRSGGLVSVGERLPNDRRPATFSLAVPRRAREAEEPGGGSPQRSWMPTPVAGEAAPPGAGHLPAG
jgi:hypothetical protein